MTIGDLKAQLSETGLPDHYEAVIKAGQVMLPIRAVTQGYLPKGVVALIVPMEQPV